MDNLMNNKPYDYIKNKDDGLTEYYMNDYDVIIPYTESICLNINLKT